MAKRKAKKTAKRKTLKRKVGKRKSKKVSAAAKKLAKIRALLK